MLERFPRYEATALALRLRSGYLQSCGFEVRAKTLDDFVRTRVSADVARMRQWAQTGTGVIYACPHYGPFLLGALLVATLGSIDSPSHVFYDPADSVPENRRFDELFQRFSGRLSVLHNEPRDLVRALRALRKKESLSIMFDVVQRPTDAMFVPFFGRLYPAMGGAVYLALQSGAPIVPAYVVPDRARKARVIFGTPIEPGHFAHLDREKAIYDMTRALFADFERQLAQAPWHWIYWGNLRAASVIAPNVLHDHEALKAEIGRRCHATPELLGRSPLLRAFVDGVPAGRAGTPGLPAGASS